MENFNCSVSGCASFYSTRHGLDVHFSLYHRAFYSTDYTVRCRTIEQRSGTFSLHIIGASNRLRLDSVRVHEMEPEDSKPSQIAFIFDNNKSIDTQSLDLSETGESVLQERTFTWNLCGGFLRLFDVVNERMCITILRLLVASFPILKEFVESLRTFEDVLQRLKREDKINARDFGFKKYHHI